MVPSVLASSVCWSLQCLFSTLTQGGRWWALLFYAHLFSHAGGREGCCKQITLACAHSVSATLGLPPLKAHTAQALGCSAGNCLRPALDCMHLPGLSHSGSGTQVVLRGADLAGPAFCALPRSSSSGVWQTRSLRLIAFPISAAQCSGCPAGAPFQADGDRPEPQEVLVSKEACLQFGS